MCIRSVANLDIECYERFVDLIGYVISFVAFRCFLPLLGLYVRF